MKALAPLVAQKTNLSMAEVEATLTRHGVDLTAASPTPGHLQLRRLRFSGTKILTGIGTDEPVAEPTVTSDDGGGQDAGLGAPPDSAAAAAEETGVEEAFDFDWKVGAGLYGIGSDRNFRGKSSVLDVMSWALRGRRDLRSDVTAWIDRVDCDFIVDSTAFHVGFKVNDGVPSGELTKTLHNQTKTTLGRFSDEAEFEALMNTAMMAELRLPLIAAAQDGRRTQHTWQAYAAALTIHGSSLEFVVGDQRWGLASRLLMMFVGADWSAVRAQAHTAYKINHGELVARQAEIDQQNDSVSAAHLAAVEVVEQVRERLAALAPASISAEQLEDALAQVTALDVQIPLLQSALLTARAAHANADEELRAVVAAAHAEREDDLAVQFFHKMRPTMCPRCDAPVTDERHRAEQDEGSCSICTHDLPSVLKTAEPDTEDDDDEDDDSVDEIAGLEQVAAAAADQLQIAQADFDAAVTQRNRHSATIASSQADQELSGQRYQAELDLARAEGRAAALEPQHAEPGSAPADLAQLKTDDRVLKAAEKIVADSVKTDQEEPLRLLSADITKLARSFGMTNLVDVELGGGASLTVHTGGTTETYGRCRRGEQLRLKLATAIALIRRSRSSGVGRHPGLLLVDSLGAEEIPDADLRAMLAELRKVTEELDTQLFIATRNADLLEAAAGADHCRLGRGSDFVW